MAIESARKHESKINEENMPYMCVEFIIIVTLSDNKVIEFI